MKDQTLKYSVSVIFCVCSIIASDISMLLQCSLLMVGIGILFC